MFPHKFPYGMDYIFTHFYGYPAYYEENNFVLSLFIQGLKP
jgi:hypothetical protein